MEITDEKPGRKIGDTLHALLNEVLEDPTKNTAEYLENRAQNLIILDEEELRSLGEKGRVKQALEEEAEVKKLHRKHKVS